MQALRNDEAARLAALAAYDILDSAPEKPFERVVRLVRKLLDVPMATVTLIDQDRQWFKARHGIEASETERKVAVCDHTIRARDPLMIPDLREDPRFRDIPAVSADSPIISYLGIPLVNEDGFALGALCAMDSVPREHAPEQVAILSDLADMVIDWMEMRRISRTDFLTGAMTRRAFRLELEKEMARFDRHRRPAAIVLFDIDHFKRINDTHGHAAGDEVLKAVVAECRERLRTGDIVARLGGEEFCLLLPETETADASVVAERFRAAIEAIELEDLPDLSITSSFGIAPLLPAHDTPEAWIHAADRALYRAKETGRNRCCLAEED